MHNYSEYGWLRGFSVVPSWGARMEEAWWSYDPGRFREEITPAAKYHANTIRLWIEFTAWMADPAGVTAAFLDAAIDEAGMKTMPCLFNRWHDSRYDYGGTYIENLHRDITPHFDYIEALVGPLASDERVLLWDLCNEPQASSPSSPDTGIELWWLASIRDVVRRCGAEQPITIGAMMGPNIETFAPLCDVLCCHPYIDGEDAIAEAVNELSALRDRLKKPMLCNETGLGGIERSEHLRRLLPQLTDAGMGWMGWALRPGAAISTRLDRIDANGLHGLGYHPWVDANGAPRRGFEWLCDVPDRLAPWLR